MREKIPSLLALLIIFLTNIISPLALLYVGKNSFIDDIVKIPLPESSKITIIFVSSIIFGATSLFATFIIIFFLDTLANLGGDKRRDFKRYFLFLFVPFYMVQLFEPAMMYFLNFQEISIFLIPFLQILTFSIFIIFMEVEYFNKHILICFMACILSIGLLVRQFSI